VLVVALLAIAIALLLPQWYRAAASILPPKEPDVFSTLTGAGGLLRGLSPGRALRGFGSSQTGYNYFAVLKSRGAMEAVVRRFDLMNVYGISDSSIEKAIKELAGNTSFETQEDDNITVEVLDKDPHRAADMANYFVDLLNEISMQLGTREAKNNREFIEKRLELTSERLRLAEDSLKGYQERSGVIFVPEANASTIAPVAELYGMKARKEVELAILGRTSSKDSPTITQLQLEVEELGKKISKIPGIGIESLRLYRELAIQQKVLEFLVPLYEQARINEQKDVPVLLVLDKAVAPERKVKPQRMLIVFLASSLALLFSIVFVMLMQGISTRRAASPLEMRLNAGVRWVAKLYHIALFT
jgi:uncharacterized protein involved in exopolysaccharide biosynthesis